MARDENELSTAGLRRQAEAILNGRKPDLEGFSQQDLQDLVHELQVHQIELELQNEALRDTRQALELARDEYAGLYDDAPVGYLAVGDDGTIARANATAAALLGAGPNALAGRPFYSLIAREDQEAYHLFLVRLLRSGGPETVELFLVRANGTRFRARIEEVASSAGQQGSNRWRAAVSDVTAEYEARRALERYAGEQRALYAVAAALVTSLDPAELTGRVLDVLLGVFGAAAGWITVPGEASAGPVQTLASRGIDAGLLDPTPVTCPDCTALLAGGSPSQAAGDPGPVVVIHCELEPGGPLAQIGLDSLLCLPLVAGDRVLGILSLVWEGRHSLADGEEHLLLAIGQQVALGLSNARLYQQARQVDRLEILVALDRALAASLDAETIAALALERIANSVHAAEAFLLPYAAWLHNAPGQVLALGEGWLDLQASEVFGRWRDWLEALGRARMGAGEFPRPVSRSTTPWGSDLVAVPIDDSDGPLADLVLSGPTLSDDDVAMARAAAGRAGQALRNARLYGEVRNLLRQREETQAMLIQTEKVAALGRLSASLSHEINNPLQSVLGCLGLAQNKLEPAQDGVSQARDDESVSRYLSIAMQELRRIAVLVHRMREFYVVGRAESVAGDVEDVLQWVVDLTRGEFKERNVEVEWQRAGPLPAVPMRADQVQQVFLNLILNAAEAMPAGGTVTLRTGQGQIPPPGIGQPTPAVRIDVQDAGQGMAPKVQQRLFEPFFTTKEGGSGLGLYICHQIVREHGGEIEIDTREGEGTTITVWLPLGPGLVVGDVVQEDGVAPAIDAKATGDQAEKVSTETT